jgi:ElaB/YqjD/DUF883 family membrane-anchored ribosome-binding protein
MARKARSAITTDMGLEPDDWSDQAELEETELRNRIGFAFNWYNYNYNQKDIKKNYIKYLKSQPKLKKHVPAINAVDPHQIGNPYAYLARMVSNGYVMSEAEQAKFDARLESLVEKGNTILATKEEKAEVKAKAPVVSIQQRVRNATAGILGEIDGEIDNYLDEGCPKIANSFDLYSFLQKNEVKGAHTRYVIAHLEEQLAELKELANGDDEQLIEGYSFLSKQKQNRYRQFIAALLAEAEDWLTNCKGTRKVRKRKVKSPKDFVKALKYKKSDEDYGIESVKPTAVLDATQVWVFDTKTRFMYKYVSNVGMVVKGTTLKEFDEVKSFKKKIRESYCKQVLKDVATGGKVKLRKVLDEINAKEVPVTGRIGKEMVILRTVK